MSSSNSPKIALVTGGNKGIGLGLVKALAALPDTHVILTARDVERGQEAVKSVAAERNNVEFMQMDVTEEKSIARVAAEIKEKYSGLDILMNNAGVAAKGDAFDGDIAQWTLGTNYFGALSVLNHFVPLMQDRPQPRVVNISSMVSQSALGNCSKELQQKFLAEDLTVEQLSDLMRQFIRDVSDNTYASKGWPKSAYGISKVGVSQLTRILARDNKNPNLLINACCPGWVRTDMAGPRAQLSVDEGVVTPMKVATLPPGSPSGKLWRHEKVAAWM